MHTLLTQLLYTVRVLRKNPGFTLSALIILALGIGANTVIFSVVNAVLLNPLPFPQADGIVTVFHVPPAKSFPGMKNFAVSAANYLDWRAQSDVFESIAIIGMRAFRLSGGSRPETVFATRTEPSFFSVVRVRPEWGRVFTDQECEPGHDTVAVLSRGFAESHFGSGAKALGQTLELNGRGYRVIGVMPGEFTVPAWSPAAKQAWVPLAWSAAERADRGNHNYLVVARVRPGVTVQAAQSQMNVISERLARSYPKEDTGWGAVVTPLRDTLVGAVRPALLTLLGAVSFVLLIACANTANLVLARTMARRKELAIRAALGANVRQIVRPVLMETTLLGLAGGALGLLFAESGQRLVVGALAEQLPRATEVRLDGPVLLFTLTVSVLTGLAAGLLACWRLMRVDPNDSLKQGLGKTDADAGGARTRSMLVVAEVALSLVLLVGAGLMIRSLWALRGVDPGFVPANVLTMTVPIPQATQATRRSRFYDEFLVRVRALPGVTQAGAIDVLPLTGGGSQQPIVIEGRPAEVFALQPNVQVRVATPGYLRAMEIPVVAGRDFDDSDTVGERAPIVISQSLAKQFWPGENPLGKKLRISFTPETLREVVGVAGDVKERGLDVLEPVATLYEPLLRKEKGTVSLVVRSNRREAERLGPAIAKVLQQVDPEAPVRDVLLLSDVVASSLAQYRFSMWLFTALAGLAFLLAAMGIYSVLAYSVRRRSHEISIRMALGAQVADVLRLVVLEGMRPTLVGVAVGSLGAYALSGVLARLVFGVSATDPYTFGAVALLLGMVALVACAIPAYRATKTEPVSALRSE